MMNLKRISFEHILYTAALLLGITIRFANLGTAPLSDSEASWALQALELAKDSRLAAQSLGPNPGYVVLTSWLFNLFGSSNFLARFWPALAGSLLILMPWVLSRRGQYRLIERKAAVLMAFGLALTPGLVAASRLAGGPMMAVAFLLLGASTLMTRPWKNWAVVAGILGGLALLSGPAVIPGLITLVLVGIFARRSYPHFESIPLSVDQKRVGEILQLDIVSTGSTLTADGLTFSFRGSIRTLLITLGLTILLVGSDLFRFPAGLAAWLDTLPVYLQGWLAPSILAPAVPALRLLAALVIYQPVAVVFGLVGAVRGLFFETGRRERFMVHLSLVWILTALILILAYPARQTVDLAWVLAPMWALAAWEIQRYLPLADNNQPQRKVNLISIIQALLLIMLFGLLWYTLASISRIQVDETGQLMRYVVIIGILALGALMTVLIQLGWSWDVARNGLAWGVLGGLALFSLSALWGTAYLRANQPQELWAQAPSAGNIALLNKTVTELSVRNTGRTDSIDIVSEVGNPSMRWALRSFPKTEFVEQFSAKTLPSILITRQTQETPTLLASYRGQDFAWWLYPGWNGALPTEIAGWLTFRSAPIQQESVILWVRSDRFPGGILVPLETESDSSLQQPASEDDSYDSSDLP